MTLKGTSGVKTAFLLVLGAVLIITVSVLSVAYGTKSMSFAAVRDAVFHMDPDNIDHVIVQTSRIPRTAGALLIGAFLAVSGALMQGMTRNYLASPSIMGISDGSVFAVTLCMVFLPEASSMAMILYSLAGSALGAFLVFGMAKLLPGGVSPLTLAVLGTIIGTFLGGVSQALAVYFQVSQNISFWYNARLHMMDPAMIRLAVPFAVVGLLLAVLMARPVTMLSLGDETAAGLGLKVGAIKTLTMLSVVLLTGISVAIAGKIAFIGLMIPHIARFLVGQDYRRIIPFAAFAGAFFLAFCDLISRYINFPFETPVGVVTALFGVPFFLYLIKTRGGGSHS
ncbi:ferrichrome ABC transporter permease [Paenibacillus sp. PK3_47]|uniref:FecCD family ABC transporter permease n=1 Tax=Paenibacillus sp. PK3_47 TaxID=2072642 RepID=UPI00201D9A01|nr:iron ABC transporter permease [Paenibacillus sp. PK3_47]UQZ35988.1 ferrichrome ABC transporter permease [Paenibacillus sp. PK3_47]